MRGQEEKDDWEPEEAWACSGPYQVGEIGIGERDKSQAGGTPAQNTQRQEYKESSLVGIHGETMWNKYKSKYMVV